MYDVDSRVQRFPRTLKHLSVQGMDMVVFLERFFEANTPIQLTSVRLDPLTRENMSISHRLLNQVGPTLTDLSIGFGNHFDARTFSHRVSFSPLLNMLRDVERRPVR